MATLTAQTRNSVTLTGGTKQQGASLSVGMSMGLLLALTYGEATGATLFTGQTRNGVTLTTQTKN